MENKGKPIQTVPSRSEYREIVKAAGATKRSLASFALFATITEARRVNREGAAEK